MYPSINWHFIVHLYCHNASRVVLVVVYSCPGNSAKRGCAYVCIAIRKNRNAVSVLIYNILPVEGFNVGRDDTLCTIAV